MARIVLVHGFWADGSSWAEVIPLLDAAGHDVLAVQLPLSSQDDDVAVVQRAVARSDGPVVLAGHSYGGVVISRAGSEPQVASLAFVSAYAPEANEDVTQLNERFPVDGPSAIRPTEDGHLWLDSDLFAAAFAGDVEPARAKVMARTQGPASFACLTPLADPPAWRAKPSTFLISTQDRTISPDAQRFMADRARSAVTEVAASHAALISQPEATARSILAATELMR